MKLICKTQYPEITVAGLGKFKAGDPAEVSDSLGGQLLLGGEWEAVGTEDMEILGQDPSAFSTPHRRKFK